MLTLTSLFVRSLLAVVAVAALAILADSGVRSQLERAVRADGIHGRSGPARKTIARSDDRYGAKGLDRVRFEATVRMVGTETAE